MIESLEITPLKHLVDGLYAQRIGLPYARHVKQLSRGFYDDHLPRRVREELSRGLDDDPLHHETRELFNEDTWNRPTVILRGGYNLGASVFVPNYDNPFEGRKSDTLFHVTAAGSIFPDSQLSPLSFSNGYFYVFGRNGQQLYYVVVNPDGVVESRVTEKGVTYDMSPMHLLTGAEGDFLFFSNISKGNETVLERLHHGLDVRPTPAHLEIYLR